MILSKAHTPKASAYFSTSSSTARRPSVSKQT